MSKITSFIDKHIIWIVAVVISVCAIIVLSGCNPVKRVLNNQKHYDKIAEHVISSGLCVNDSVYVSDTTILLDTLFALDYKTDTFTIDKVTYITKTDYKTIVKTVTIRDTVILTDNSRLNLLQKEISLHLQTESKLRKDIVNIEAEKLSMKQSRNKWRFRFWILIAVISVVILRKPIIGLVKKAVPVTRLLFK